MSDAAAPYRRLEEEKTEQIPNTPPPSYEESHQHPTFPDPGKISDAP